MVVVVALLVVAILGYGLYRARSNSPDRLLLRAYSEQRTLELRFSGAGYGPLQARTGTPGSTLAHSQALLEAEAQLGHLLQKTPAKPELSQQQGRADLLEWSYEAAIADFQQALESQPKSTEILNDLASGYFERAESEKNFSDYATAYELQSRALQAGPENPVVLFNRAITAEKLFLLQQSMEDWERYLRVDPSGEWAAESRERLDQVKHAVEAHEGRMRVPLLSPAEFAGAVDPSEPQTWDRVDPRIEQYLSAAITDWLPSAFPGDRKTPASSDARKALAVLAVILRERHGDTWLADVISAESSPALAQAAVTLGQATAADNVTEDFAGGLRDAAKAAEVFKKIGNRAGTLRAQFEEIYALRFSDRFSDCLRKADGLSSALAISSYRWLQAQLRLEQYNCLIGSGQLSGTHELGNAAYQDATAAHYPAIALRALGFLAVDESDEGRPQHSWNLCRDGLARYWSNSVSPTPGYNVYVQLSLLAEDSQRWRVGVALEEQALAMLGSGENRIERAIEYTLLAHAAAMAEDSEKAKASLQTAEQLFSSAPQTGVTQNYRLKMEIEEAGIEAQAGSADAALNRLLALQPRIDRTDNWYTALEYYQALGDLQGKRKNLAGSVAAYESAVALAERRRSSITSESDRASWARQSVTSYRKLVQALLQEKDSANALNAWELYQSATLRSPGPGTLQASLNEESTIIQNALHSLDEHTVLIYVVLPDGIEIWIYDGGNLSEVHIAKDPAQVQILAQHLEELCAKPSSALSAIQASSKELYQILIAPIARNLRHGRPLLIETDDTLAGVPFQVLMDPAGQYLADSNPIVYSRGLSYLASNRREELKVASRTGISHDDALVVEGGLDTAEPTLQALDDAKIEANAVAHHFPGAHLLTEDQASLPAVKRQLRQAEVFHFVGHTGTVGSRTGLLLAAAKQKRESAGIFDSSILDSASLPKLKIAVLSACSTETGRERNTLDPEGLARAFLRAGTPHVVATRWNIDSAVSSALMRAFYDSLLSGEKVPAALALAEARVRKKEAHPYYWAAFDAIGR